MAKKKPYDPVGNFAFGANRKARKPKKTATKGGKKNAWQRYTQGK